MDHDSSSIAVIGMAGRFPGADNVDQFWYNLRNGVESVTDFTEEELLESGVTLEMLRDPNYVRRRAIVSGVDLFDADYFGYSPREAEVLDPQQRLFLECSVHALEHAGHTPTGFSGRIGVFAGSSWSTYFHNNLLARAELAARLGSFHLMLANDKDYLNTRVSYDLNLTGPSVNVNTSCSTSLVAVHLACQSLLLGESDMALAGGVSVLFPVRVGYLFEKGGIVSPDGCCRAFDAKAEGMVPGAGCAIVVLRRLEDAVRDRDRIIAVIRGSAINNDGSAKIGFTAPSVTAQAEVITDALAVAGVPAETIGYVEAHGTATPVGDPIEVTALTRAFRTHTSECGYCGLGSVKSNIGHLGAAAGVAGLIKAALSIYHRELPPSLHFTRPHPQIDFAASPFYVVDQLQQWHTDAPLRAGVSSLGIGGTNAHVVLEQAPQRAATKTERPWEVLLLSARSEDGLASAADRLCTTLGNELEIDLADVAFTLRAGRSVHEVRGAVVVRDVEDAQIRLKELRGITATDDQSLQFYFPAGGLGAGVIRELSATEPDFQREFDWCHNQLWTQAPATIRQVAGEQGSKGHEQWSGIVGAWALARMLISWGIVPDTVSGDGDGLTVAALTAGAVEPGLLGQGREAIVKDSKIPLVDPVSSEVLVLGAPLPERHVGGPGYEDIRLVVGNGGLDVHGSVSRVSPGEESNSHSYAVMAVVGQLFLCGRLTAPGKIPGGQRISLPGHEFKRKRYFIDPPSREKTPDVPEVQSNYNRPDTMPYSQPQGDLEQTIAGVWEELLGVVPVGRDDDFFDLGGHSLLATQVISRLRQLFPVSIPLQALFDAPTIAELGEMIEEQLVRLVEQMSDDQDEH